MRAKVNLTIEKSVTEEARHLKLNMSRIAEEAIARAAKEERHRRWKEENRAAIDEYNAYIEKNGLPLAKYRQF